MLFVAEEVREALATGGPVVALESSVVAQGLPPPKGVEAAQACETAVRREGAVPATVALLDGRIVVGATAAELERLADPPRKVAKAGVRDLAVLCALGRDAGTTVSGTIYAAVAAGIRLFATGGIGGVHRAAGVQAWDVSSDLTAMAEYPVAVVSAGAKAILDLPATMELLETLGVPVVGLGVDELPAFYTNRSGLALEHRVDDAAAAARILETRWNVLGQRGGVLFANPVPAGRELPGEQVEEAIGRALAEAEAAGVKGKAATPFLLGRLAREPALAAVETNLALLESNAAAAARIAVALSSHGASRR